MHGNSLIFVQQAQLPDSDGDARESPASDSWFDAAAVLPRVATSVIKIGHLLQQEQALFLRVGLLCTPMCAHATSTTEGAAM